MHIARKMLHLAAAFGLAAGLSATAFAADDTIKIGVGAATTGKYAAYGQPIPATSVP